MGSIIKLKQSGYSGNATLWYDQSCVDLVRGTGQMGSEAGTLILESGSYRDDYYNGRTLEVFAGTGEGTRAEVTDYVAATRALSLSGTFGTDSVYGMVSVLPSEAYDAWVARAVASCLSKSSGVVSEEFLNSSLLEAKLAEDAFFEWVQLRVRNTRRITLTEDWL